MTENEALKRMKMCIGVSPSENIISSFKLMSDALDELQRYRAIGTVEEFRMLKDHLWTLNEIAKDYSAIGTVEEFKRAKEMESVYGQVKRERDIAISQLEEIGVSLGQKMDEFKALKEKSVAKKPEPIDYEKYIDVVENAKFLRGAYWCPNCKHTVRSGAYCDDCGQKLDWQ